MTDYQGQLGTGVADDVAISPDGSTIYEAGADGNLYAYSASTGQLLHTWAVGTDLGGMDISPDGSFAIVTELQPISSVIGSDWTQDQFTVAVYKVDLSTGQVTPFETTVLGDQGAFYDAAIQSDGTVLLSEQNSDGISGWAPLAVLDPSTGTFAFTNASVRGSSFLSDSNGSITLVGEYNISDAPLDIFTAGAGITSNHSEYEDAVYGFNSGVQAISAQAGLVAQNLGSQINIYDSQLHYQFDLGQLDPEVSAGGVAGLAFDSTGQNLFVLNVQTDIIYQVSTTDWSVVGEFPVGVDITSNLGDFGNRLLVSPDSSYFTVQTDDGHVVVVDAVRASASDGADFLVGGPAGDTIDGLGGNDVIHGLGGDDVLHGGAGDDIIDGGPGNDTIAGGPGTDILTGGDGTDTFVFQAGDGSDTITDLAPGETVQIAGYTTAQSITQSGTDVILKLSDTDAITFSHASVSAVESVLSINMAGVPIYGTVGGDIIHGTAGPDIINGLDGNDTLDGGAGDDVLTGGDGNDVFIVGDGNDTVTDLSAGDSIIVRGAFSAQSVNQVGSNVVVALSNGNQLTVQNSDVASVESAMHFEEARPNDVVVSPDGSTIYAAGDDGNLNVYNAATGVLLHSWHVGTELGGMDISPDGSFAVITELQPLTSSASWDWPNNQFTAAVYKVDLSTGDVTTYTTNLTGDEFAFYDASILNNGQVLLTEQILPGWSGWVPMRTLNLTTGQFAIPSGAQITENSVLSGGGDGSGTLVGEVNISDARLEMFTSGTGITAVHENYADNVYGFNDGVQAYNAHSGLAVQSVGSDIYVYN
ncbi:MAG TPA: hypothetical protein VGQ34_04440, partial [Sphingomicrobium sp.]|nr:hypothetical protein [Sphingomicrobium sp.]